MLDLYITWEWFSQEVHKCAIIIDMSAYLIDTHCHLHDQEFFTPTQAVEFLQNAKAAGVQQIICIGTDPEDSEAACQFSLAHENVFWTYGIHPEHAGKIQAEIIEKWCKNLQNQSSSQPSQPRQGLVAIGEIGLDYHYEGYSREAQIRLFEQMLQLATDLQLPVSLHIREAYDDAWAVLDNFPGLIGVVHSFTGSKRDLRAALERGFTIGVNGLVTYTTPPLPPLDKMVLETDAPFLTPVPFRGTINQSAYIREIAEYLAEKMGVAEVIIAEQTTKNARQLFHLGDANSK